MTATAAQIARIRLMVDEPATATYGDAIVQGYIEEFPVLDERGEIPYTWDTSTTPPSKKVNAGWIPTYDLHAAAAAIWEQKAATAQSNYSFSADGVNHSRNQVFENCMKQAAYHTARKRAKTARFHPYPPQGSKSETVWIGNLAEDNN